MGEWARASVGASDTRPGETSQAPSNIGEDAPGSRLALRPLPPAVCAEAVARRRTFVRYLQEGPLPRLHAAAASAGEPRVTVIVPTADGSRGGNLARLVAQLAGQTYRRFEVIVVEGDRRQGRAINTAAALARGDLLVTMDDDTRLGHDDLLERLVRAFDDDATIGIAGVGNLVPADAPRVVRRAMRELPRRSSPVVDRVTDSDLAEHPCLGIRKALFYRIGGEHEWIPRGLDPYLRREVRRAGYRVVVIPHAWIHHLLPPTLRGILRQYVRNGRGAAYVRKCYPRFVIGQAASHDRVAPGAGTLGGRAARYAGRLLGAVLTLRWLYLAVLVCYAAGYVWGLATLRRDDTP